MTCLLSQLSSRTTTAWLNLKIAWVFRVWVVNPESVAVLWLVQCHSGVKAGFPLSLCQIYTCNLDTGLTGTHCAPSVSMTGKNCGVAVHAGLSLWVFDINDLLN